MPVDDIELENMYQLVLNKLEINRQEETSLKIFLHTCNEIKKIPSKEDPNVMQDILDRNLGIKMAFTRRQAIYDKLLDDKTTLGL